MAVSSISGNLGTIQQVSSSFGSTSWSAGSGNVLTQGAAGFASGWVIFQLQISGLTPAEAFNGMRVQGVHDFLVGGGAGTIRLATGYWKMASSVAAFSGAASDGTVGSSINGSGIGQTIDFVASGGSLDSSDFLNGTAYIGYAVSADNGDSAMGVATYRTSALSFTVYTGTDTPNPPPTGSVVAVTNPSGNTNPGKNPGGIFDALSFDYQQPLPRTSIQLTWTLSDSDLTWESTGGQVLNQFKGTGSDPTHPYTGSTERVLVDAGIAPGLYNVTLLATSVGAPDFNGVYNLQVNGLGQGSFAFHEF